MESLEREGGSLSSRRCWLCNKGKLVYGYIAPHDQRATLELSSEVYVTEGGRRVPLAEKFDEPYKSGATSVLSACKTCDGTSEWLRRNHPG